VTVTARSVCAWVGLVVACGVVSAPKATRACATAWPSDPVAITREQAIVVWDPTTKRERFIRRAQFQTTSPDFGFLVPTPTKPELEEASDGAFEALDRVVQDARKQVVQRDWEVGCLASLFMNARRYDAVSAGVTAESGVTVLDTKTVAGLDATVLDAASAEGLTTWLNAHGYAQRPQITEWLAPYVAAKYKITAFKYSRAEARPTEEMLSKAVMLTFDAARPFYPYREPADAARVYGRVLRVFVVAPGRMEGAFDGEGDTTWPVSPLFAMPLAGRDGKLGAELPAKLLPPGAWLTVMNDPADRREPRDVVFALAKDQTPVEPPPSVWHKKKVWIPVEGGLLLTAIVALVWRAGTRKVRARKRALTPPEAGPPPA
jgi:Uncharacterized protein conserved in bacteria (DUF2330)